VSESINFDRADYVEVSALNCKLCRQPLEKTNITIWRRNNLCSMSRQKSNGAGQPMPVHTAFVRAVGFGLAAAAVGAVVYALIVI